ncbi:MAG: YeeE/YedE family protein, partial [Syntrophobacterales bacterium]
GSVQLAVSGYIALICFFIGGMVVARVLYGGGGRI